MTSPSPERNGSPISSPCGETIAVKQPPEIRPMAARVAADLCLLVGIEPAGCVDNEATRLQRVMADVDLDLLAKRSPANEPGYIAEWICSPSAIIA